MVNKNKLLSCSSTGSASDLLLARLCDEFTAARRNGQSISVEDVIRQYPEHADQIRTAFDALQLFAKFPQATWKPDAVDELPERIARFDIVRMIGRGGMGVVYEATHPSVSRRVAIKVLKPELLASENFAARFRLEAEAASRLNHPNIVPFIDYGDDNGAAYMSMLYIDGESLDHVLNRFRNDSAADSDSTSFVANDFPRIAQIGASVASALAQAHQQHAIHRDIKPANLILDKAGKIWVTDFGLAKLRDDDTELSCLGDMIGTPRYMAPEQIRGISDERSDIYSLGATLYELATGQKPWDPATTPAGSRERGRLPAVRTINPHVPVGLATIIAKACHANSRHRYKNAAELQFALNQFAHGGTVEDRRRLRGERPAPSRFRDIVLATALVGSLTVAAVLSNTGGKIAEVVSADVAFAADTNDCQ